MLLFHRPKAFKLAGICYQKVTKVEFEFSLQVAEHPLVSDNSRICAEKEL